MKKLLSGSKSCIRTMDLTDMALLKLCLIAMGILIGLCIPSKSKKYFGLLMSILFAGTSIPLMRKFIPAFTDASED